MLQVEVPAAGAAAFLGEALRLTDDRPPGAAAAGANGEDGAAAVLAAVRELGLVQMDPVRIVERNHDLVLRNRIGGYRPAHLEQALDRRLVFEYRCGNRSLLPMDDYPWFMPSMARREKHHGKRLAELDSAVRAVLSALEKTGPLTSRAIDSAERVSGYWDANEVLRTKATSHALQLLWECGRVIAAGRRNGEIVFDLPGRVIPAGLLTEGRRMTEPDAAAFLRRKYYRAYRLFDEGHALFGFQGLKAAERREAIREDLGKGLIVAVRIKGVRRPYYCLAADAERLGAAAALTAGTPAARILPPLENLLWRRPRLLDLYRFAYTWEIYTPERKRKYGPYTMPVLYGTAIPARIDLKYDREKAALVVLALHPGQPGEEGWPKKPFRAALARELGRLRDYLGASTVEWSAAGSGA